MSAGRGNIHLSDTSSFSVFNIIDFILRTFNDVLFFLANFMVETCSTYINSLCKSIVIAYNLSLIFSFTNRFEIPYKNQAHHKGEDRDQYENQLIYHKKHQYFLGALNNN